jgi:hypothetical protein
VEDAPKLLFHALANIWGKRREKEISFDKAFVI